MKDEGDVKVFVEIGTHGRIIRRLLRDIERTGKKPSDILSYFAEVVEPMHEKYVESAKKNSDIIISNEYSPEIEAGRSGLHEIQLKFKTAIDTETLRKIGAEQLGTVTQIDTYYNPHDRNLVETGKILRIREEGGHRILTYKGPKIEGKFRENMPFLSIVHITLTSLPFLCQSGSAVSNLFPLKSPNLSFKNSSNLFFLSCSLFSRSILSLTCFIC